MALPGPGRMKAAPPAFFLVHCAMIVANAIGFVTRAVLEHFDGPHRIHGAGTFEFLRRHLNVAHGMGDP